MYIKTVKTTKAPKGAFLWNLKRFIYFLSSNSLANFSEYFGEERAVSVSRELTKLFEETKRGTISEVLSYYTNKPPKGEIVIVVAGKK